ncbi:ATP-binding protein [Roseomonas sp. NAR14]|uniref:histidine kinase n=1 Tax=Roseomonas acroporae TaxID=2937791 RepID=A0A9X2BS61_9PROT|nr:PAS domain-containing sensor histidine kinase [Roseomonas acroporae]MCK8782772.1 ATP-binding protein [Roseomonas acroporae]
MSYTDPPAQSAGLWHRLATWLAGLWPPGPRRGDRLAEAEALRLVFDRAPAGLALLDADGTVLAANPTLRRFAGPAVLLRGGVAVTALVPPEERGEVLDRIAAARLGLPVPPLESGLSNPAAPPDACYALTCEPLLPDRDPRFLLRVVELTARRRLEAQLGRGRQLQAVGQLAGGVAHDFNNLLTAVIGSAESALQRPQDPDSAADLRQILDSAERGAALVRQLLAFARQQALQPRVVAVNERIAGIAGLLRRLLGERVRLELELEQPGRAVRVDPTQLDQVIVNLAANARNAMPHGGRLTLRTHHEVVLSPRAIGHDTVPPGRYVVLEVADTGCGIPPEVLPRLFEPFFTTRRESGGTGLGLSTVHGIVRQSGGYLGVESEVGRGTAFRVYLPRHEGAAEPEVAAAPLATSPAAPSSGPPSGSPSGPSFGPPTAVPSAAPPIAASAVPSVARAAAPAAGEGRTVLLVEDESPVRRLAERSLQASGWSVVPADCGETALDLLPEGAPAPAILVSDVVMPGEVDGLDLARALRRRWPGLPVVLVSGYAETTLGQDLGGEGLRLLAKPYTQKELAGIVAELAGNDVHVR